MSICMGGLEHNPDYEISGGFSFDDACETVWGKLR